MAPKVGDQLLFMFEVPEGVNPDDFPALEKPLRFFQRMYAADCPFVLRDEGWMLGARISLYAGHVSDENAVTHEFYVTVTSASWFGVGKPWG